MQQRFGIRSGEQLRFGEYQVHRISREGVRSRGGIVDALKGKTELQQRYSFRLRLSSEEEDRWTARCDSRDVEQAIRLGTVGVTLGESASLECSLIEPDDTAAAWKLRLVARGDAPLRGSLEREEIRYELEGERTDPTGPPARVAGFVIRRDERLLGAVETVRPGAVRLIPDVGDDERHLLAAAAAALLLRSELISESGG